MNRAAIVFGSAVLSSGIVFGPALAADFVLTGPVVSTPGVITYSLGVAAGGIHNQDGGNGILSNGGADASDTRYSLSVDGTFGYYAGDGLGVLVEAKGSMYSDPAVGDLGDWTRYHADVTGHMFYSPSETFLIGAFIGVGRHDDTGDSDEDMGYWFDGIEASAGMGWGNIFGQIGYLDSFDEYDEGTQSAPFIRVGATYFIDDNFAVTAAGSLAGGVKYDDDDYPNRIIGLEIEPEYKFAESPISVFARYEFNQISYETPAGDRYGDTFHAFKVGLRIRSDGTLRDNLSGGGSLSSPMAGPWVAYNANEIE